MKRYRPQWVGGPPIVGELTRGQSFRCVIADGQEGNPLEFRIARRNAICDANFSRSGRYDCLVDKPPYRYKSGSNWDRRPNTLASISGHCSQLSNITGEILTAHSDIALTGGLLAAFKVECFITGLPGVEAIDVALVHAEGQAHV